MLKVLAEFNGPESEFDSFKGQETLFILLNLLILGLLAMSHLAFASSWGNTTRSLAALCLTAFLVYALELAWIRARKAPLRAIQIRILTWSMIAANTAVACGLQVLTDRQDTRLFALMVVPVLAAAFRFSLAATIMVVGLAAAVDFSWVWRLHRTYSPDRSTNYFESVTIALAFLIIGWLLWTLVNTVRTKHADVLRTKAEMDRVRQRYHLVDDRVPIEKFASTLAHEVRNPVTLISHSLALAMRPDVDVRERHEMFEIAAREACRLERLTTDFLEYARPRPSSIARLQLADIVNSVVSICRPLARERSIVIELTASDSVATSIDVALFQQALLNLMMNAVEASADGGTVLVRCSTEGARNRIDVVNANGPIGPSAVNRIFEPFFTTKPAGTGLGLCIARNAARTLGGDVILAINETNCVQFSFFVP